MKKFNILVLVCTLFFQTTYSQKVEKLVVKEEAEQHLRYLSSDEMMGRDTGSPEIEMAADYIVEQFKKYGVKLPEGHDTYFQKVPLMKTNVPTTGEVILLDSALSHGKNILVLRGKDTTALLPAVFAGYGLEADLEAADIKGKLVVTRFGAPGMTNPREGFAKSREKRKMVADRGALGMIELYSSRQIVWPMLVLYLNNPSMILDDHSQSENATPYHAFVNDADEAFAKALQEQGVKHVKMDVQGLTPQKIKCRNIIGYIEGSDKKLKDEFVVLSAHYDHVGHTNAGVDSDGEPTDSIFNGARDNALGVTGLLMAAKYLAKAKPARSVLFVFFTAEEKGLLGSEYYAENPWAPLEKCIFNLNMDCAGYNDTTKATIFGLTRNTAEKHLQSACSRFGLEAMDDPIPEQNIFERSDHFNFAKKGVPCVLFGPGLTSFDEEIQKYYHQLIDHAETLDFDYLTKLYKTFAVGAESIANDPEAPSWVEGDKYENAGKKLYNIN